MITLEISSSMVQVPGGLALCVSDIDVGPYYMISKELKMNPWDFPESLLHIF